jgi:hypothetical protein
MEEAHTFIHYILPHISLEDIGNVGAINRQFATIFNNPETWRIVVNMAYPKMIDWKPVQMTWKRYYYELLWSLTSLPTMAGTSQEWRLNGQLHRIADQPAIILADKTQMWYQQGQQHRDGDRPAYVWQSRHNLVGPECHQEWYQHGHLHRENDKPAVIWIKMNNVMRFWYQNGNLHRDNDQPAIVCTDGHQEWWVNGVRHK